MTYSPADRLAKRFGLYTTKCPQAVHQSQIFDSFPHFQSLSHAAEQSGWRVTNMAIEAVCLSAISIIPYYELGVNQYLRCIGVKASVGDSPRRYPFWDSAGTLAVER